MTRAVFYATLLLVLLAVIVGCAQTSLPGPSVSPPPAKTTPTPSTPPPSPTFSTPPTPLPTAELKMVYEWTGNAYRTIPAFHMLTKPWLAVWYAEPVLPQSPGRAYAMIADVQESDSPFDTIMDTRGRGYGSLWVQRVGRFYIYVESTNIQWRIQLFQKPA